MPPPGNGGVARSTAILAGLVDRLSPARMAEGAMENVAVFTPPILMPSLSAPASPRLPVTGEQKRDVVADLTEGRSCALRSRFE